MLPDEWRTVQKILAVQLGNADELITLSPALEQLKRAVPDATITVLCSPRSSRVALSLPAVDEVLLYRALAHATGTLDCNSLALLPLIERLRSQQFDAAILFAQAAQSPYPLAYVCYLAEIPMRVGWSDEFGGGLLSHWVKDEGEGDAPKSSPAPTQNSSVSPSVSFYLTRPRFNYPFTLAARRAPWL